MTELMVEVGQGEVTRLLEEGVMTELGEGIMADTELREGVPTLLLLREGWTRAGPVEGDMTQPIEMIGEGWRALRDCPSGSDKRQIRR